MLTGEQREEIRQRRAAGEKLRALASEYQVSHETIRRVVAAPGARSRTRLAERWAAVDQAAGVLGVSEAEVVLRCERGELQGAVRLGRATWLVPWSLLKNVTKGG